MRKEDIRRFIRDFLIKPKYANRTAWMVERGTFLGVLGAVNVTAFLKDNGPELIFMYAIGLLGFMFMYFVSKGR